MLREREEGIAHSALERRSIVCCRIGREYVVDARDPVHGPVVARVPKRNAAGAKLQLQITSDGARCLDRDRLLMRNAFIAPRLWVVAAGTETQGTVRTKVAAIAHARLDPLGVPLAVARHSRQLTDVSAHPPPTASVRAYHSFACWAFHPFGALALARISPAHPEAGTLQWPPPNSRNIFVAPGIRKRT